MFLRKRAIYRILGKQARNGVLKPSTKQSDMEQTKQNAVLKSLLKIWGQVEYNYEDNMKTVRQETMNALKQYGFQFK